MHPRLVADAVEDQLAGVGFPAVGALGQASDALHRRRVLTARLRLRRLAASYGHPITH